jgi:hypothetical protein
VDPGTLDDLTHILQLSITPVALISGVGLLLLSITNRLGRVIDRVRRIAAQRESGDREVRREELTVLWRRARFLLLSIASIATSIFLAVLVVAVLFVMNLSGASLGTLVLVLFGLCLACLAASMSFFLGDIFLSIRWLRVTLGEW